MTTETRSVIIYTDGACLGNPGAGGYGVVLIHKKHRKELFGGYRLTTNNRMEMMAAIVGLEALKESCAVKLHTDSKYLQESISLGWVERWRAKGWKKGRGERLNRDLWERLLDLCAKHDVEFIWVRGHAGDVENERCDFLSMQAAQKSNLPPDAAYEEPPPSSQQTRSPSLFDL